MLHQAKRYDKLNQVLALLEQARGDQEAGGEGGRISELKDHIKTALDEAIRLRADTDALQTRAGVSHGSPHSKKKLVDLTEIWLLYM